jgi:hypothetical protein
MYNIKFKSDNVVVVSEGILTLSTTVKTLRQMVIDDLGSDFLPQTSIIMFANNSVDGYNFWFGFAASVQTNTGFLMSSQSEAGLIENSDVINLMQIIGDNAAAYMYVTLMRYGQ